MNCKIALVFVIMLAVVVNYTQAKSIHEIKDDVNLIKKSAIATKLGISNIVAAKLKLAALKKLAAIKAIAKAPFVLAKKAALLKIGAVKSLAGFKAAKVKKVVELTKEKTAPAVAAVAKIPAAGIASVSTAVAGVSTAVAGVSAAVAGIPAAVVGLPSAAIAALKPKLPTQSHLTHHTVLPAITLSYPSLENSHKQSQHQIPANTHHYYKSGLDGPRTYSNDYSLVPENEFGSQHYSAYDIIQPHQAYGVPAN